MGDGRPVVAAFSWFNEDMAGGTYNLRLFDDDGSVNALGRAYMNACQAWGSDTPIPPAPTPPTPPTPSTTTPAPPPTPGSWTPCSGGTCCNPHTAEPQYCPGN